MSNTPGISPITTDIEDVRHSEDGGLFGDEEPKNVVPEETPEDKRDPTTDDYGRGQPD